jgi:hypothetical protein
MIPTEVPLHEIHALIQAANAVLWGPALLIS